MEYFPYSDSVGDATQGMSMASRLCSPFSELKEALGKMKEG